MEVSCIACVQAFLPLMLIISVTKHTKAAKLKKKKNKSKHKTGMNTNINFEHMSVLIKKYTY